jgi:hypothetical protein
MGAGEYRPATAAGHRLLAHELAHVVQQAGNATAVPGRLTIGRSDGPAEREADRVADTVVAAGASAHSVVPLGSVPAGTVSRQPQLPGASRIPRVQTVRRDFHDPNFCYKIPLRDATHPDRSHVVAVMQAEIQTPRTCDGEVVLRTSVLNSAWGAASAQFESLGGGVSLGVSESITRGEERVDYEERFRPDACQAYFDRCHMITYYDDNRRFAFADALYRPRVLGVSTPTGPGLQDDTPAPDLVVEPCDAVTSRCGGTGGQTSGPSGGAQKPIPPGPRKRR